MASTPALRRPGPWLAALLALALGGSLAVAPTSAARIPTPPADHAQAVPVDRGAAPGCDGTPPDGEIGDLCPDEESESITVSITGSVGESSSAEVLIDPGAPPCSVQDAGTDIFTPDGCYSAVRISLDNSPACAWLDSYDDGVDRASTYTGYPSYPCDTNPYGFITSVPDSERFGGPLSLDYVNFAFNTRLPRTCAAAFNEAYSEGGPAPDETWPTVGPQSLDCTFAVNPRPGQPSAFNGLFGPTWIGASAEITLEYSDGSSELTGAPVWLSADGTERPRSPRAEFDDEKIPFPSESPTDATYRFTDESRSQQGHGLEFDWVFEVIDTGQTGDEYRLFETSSVQNPEIFFTEGDFYRATLTATDLDNGLIDVQLHGGTIRRAGTGGGGGGSGSEVSVEAIDAVAREAGSDTGTWELTRTLTNGPLTVNVSTSGTATEGADYTAVAGTVTFPADANTATVKLRPLNDTRVEPHEIATLTIEPGNGYTVGDPEAGDIVIVSDDLGTCAGKAVTIAAKPGVKTVGTKKNDVILGTSGKDTIVSKGGNDVVCALGGNDVVKGGGGNDKILGQGGADTLRGGGGKDKLVGGGGPDVLVGGKQKDSCAGGKGKDTARQCE